METIEFKKNDNGFYYARFMCSGVVTIHVEYDTERAVNTIFAISSFPNCKFKDDETIHTNPVDGDWQIGDGNTTKYLEIRCPMMPSKGIINGNIEVVVEE